MKLKRGMIDLLLIILMGVVPTVYAIRVFIKQQRYESDLSSKVDTIRALQKELRNSQEELAKEQGVVRGLQEETIKKVTGSGFCTLSFAKTDKPNEFVALLLNRNNYESLNVILKVTSGEDIIRCYKGQIEGFTAIDTNHFYEVTHETKPIEVVRPHSSTYLNDFRIRKSKQLATYEIVYHSKSTQYFGQFVIELEGRYHDECRYAYRIWEFPVELKEEPKVLPLPEDYIEYNELTAKVNWDELFPVPVHRRRYGSYD